MRFKTFVEAGMTHVDPKDVSTPTQLKLVNTPQEAAEIIYRDCRPYLNAINGNVLEHGKQLLRGMSHIDTNTVFDLIEPKGIRRPKDTSTDIHITLDNFFEDRFGIPHRSESVFATGSPLEAYSYGRIFMMFPIGDFYFVWSPIVSDAFDFFDGFKNGDNPKVLKKFKEYFSEHNIATIAGRDEKKDAIHTYTLELQHALRTEDFGYQQHDLLGAIKSGNEIMVRCSEYYVIGLDNRPGPVKVTPGGVASNILQHLANLIDS